MSFPTRRSYKSMIWIAKVFPIAMLLFDLILSVSHSTMDAETYQRVFFFCVPNIGTSTLWTALVCYIAFHFEMCTYARVGYFSLFLLSILDAAYYYAPFGEVYYLYGAISAIGGLLITILFILKNKGL